MSKLCYNLKVHKACFNGDANDTAAPEVAKNIGRDVICPKDQLYKKFGQHPKPFLFDMHMAIGHPD